MRHSLKVETQNPFKKSISPGLRWIKVFKKSQGKKPLIGVLHYKWGLGEAKKGRKKAKNGQKSLPE